MKESKELLKRKIFLRIFSELKVFVDDEYLSYFIKDKKRMKMAKELGWL